MKWLFLMIRHFRPISRWKIIETTDLYDSDKTAGRLPVAKRFLLQDQFGNLKTFKH